LVPEQGWRVADTVNLSRLNLKPIAVCALTGELPGRDCPQTRTGWFIPGTSPIRVCTVHRAIPIDSTTGRRACRYDPAHTRMQTFEFWPSDLSAVFRMAGITIKSPPPFAETCALDRQAAAGLAPAITSPQPDLVYALRSDRPTGRGIPFAATTDADVRRLYWFVNNGYVGSSNPREPFLWPARGGDFDLRVVDDHGRAAHLMMTVQWIQ
ncbi:hypothetical protein, partial [Desulfosarcina cetonica]|uniref:hypothetical protein n=1 Tax=Desulfosarcina cetonica TaxID=90730 RepID=UPI00248C686F